MSKPNTKASSGETVAPALQRQIDENLKLLYSQCFDDKLPDNLQALVARLRSDGKPS